MNDSDVYDVDPLFPPNSPKKPSTNLLQRMDSIAPGPFNAGGRRPSTRNGPSSRGSPDRGINDGYNERPGTSASNSGYGSMRAPRAPRKNDYGGFGPPQRDQDDFVPQPFGINRSETFPKPSEIQDAPARTPSAPGPRPDRFRRPSEANGRPPLTSDRMRRPSRDPDMSRPPPPRTSLIRPRTAGGMDSPAVPSINLAAEFGVGNPYHTPSDSVSSSYSSYGRSDQSSQPSSRSSPERSANPRKPSDLSKFDNLMSDLQSSMDEFKKGGRSPTLPRPRFENPFTSNGRSQPRAGGYDPRIDPAVQSPRLPRSRSPLASPAFDRFQDPAVQGGDRDPSPRSRAPRSASSGPRERNARSRSRSATRNPALAAPSRGDCKSCGLAIRGKSISSADGRLTGRYHKACFVCETCREPFTSSTFYVLDDRPYCELHYHELNGSLCGGCGNGIEGQYLEDESSTKHHLGCFRCGDCNVVLRDGYFEVNGKAYCEKDAWKRVQQPWMNNNNNNNNGIGGGPRKGSMGPGAPMGMPPRPGGGGGGLPPRGGAFGLPSSIRLGPGPRPKMEKRMTRLGIM